MFKWFLILLFYIIVLMWLNNIAPLTSDQFGAYTIIYGVSVMVANIVYSRLGGKK